MSQLFAERSPFDGRVPRDPLQLGLPWILEPKKPRAAHSPVSPIVAEVQVPQEKKNFLCPKRKFGLQGQRT